MSERIRITSDQIPAAAEPPGRPEPPLDPRDAASSPTEKLKTKLRSTWFVYFIAGIGSGLGGSLLAETIFRLTGAIRGLETGIISSGDVVVVTMSIAILGGVIAASLASSDLLAAGAYRRSLYHAGISLAVGCVGTIAALAITEIGLSLAEELLSRSSSRESAPSMAYLVLRRGIAWMALGATVGFAAALPSLNRRSFAICGFGGAIGGLAAGLIFDPIAMATGTGTASRIIGFTLFAIFIAAAIVLTAETTKNAWIQVTHGPLRGKQFLLSRESTTVGSQFRADVFLPKDRRILPHHATLRKTSTGFLLTPAGEIRLNRRLVNSPQVLRNLDQLQLGDSMITFHARR